jgi:hypothetical protein
VFLVPDLDAASLPDEISQVVLGNSDSAFDPVSPDHTPMHHSANGISMKPQMKGDLGNR